MTEATQRRFWRDRALSEGPIRWTGQGMLAQDLAIINEAIVPQASLLDLGCGSGDLFLPILDQLSEVMAVDVEAGLLARIPEDPRIQKQQASVLEFAPNRTWDVGLLFGVVTCLSETEEHVAYRLLRKAVPEGTVIVKNQCGRTDEVIVDGWSEDLGRDYSARYPAVEKQASDLAEVFGSVEVRPYPEELNKWENTAHFAFVCR